MSSHRDDDLEPALRAMLGDPHLDVRPRGDAVGTVLAGVGRARRLRTTAYVGASTLVLAGVLGGIVLTSGDEPQGFQPVVPGSTESSTATPTRSVPPTVTSAAPTDPPVPATSSSAPPSVPVEPVVEMLGPDGIGEIVLGMPVADAYGTDTLGMYDPITDTLTPWDGSAAGNVCLPAGQARRTTPDLARVWMDDELGVVEIAIWPASNPDVQTVEGLRTSDDPDRILELYPDARVDDSNPNMTIFYVDNWGGHGNVLKIRDHLTLTVLDIHVALAGHSGCYDE